MGCPDNAPRTAIGVLLSPPISPPRLFSGCPLDRWGEDTHTLNSWGNRAGNNLIFIPLLTLSANVMHKFEDANTTWGNIGAYHLNKLYDSNCSALARLIRRCLLIERSTTSKLFFFLSLQFLVNHRDAFDVFVTCAQERTLCVITVFTSSTGLLSTMIFVRYVLNFLDGYMAINHPINVCA